MRRCLINALFAVTFTFAAPALAQDAGCPPGSWFCEAVPERPAPAPEADPSDDEDAPPPPESLPQPPARRRQIPHMESRPAPPPPVVVYRPASPSAPPPRAQVVIVAPGVAPPPPPARKVVVVTQRTAAPQAAPVAKQKRWHRRWGLNLRMEGASFGGPERGGDPNAGMGGVGLSLRYRPVPAFAFDAGIDVLGGTDYNGFSRTEVPFSLSGMLFVNPRSRLQFYLLAGGHVSHAEIETDTYEPLRDGTGDAPTSMTQYSYVGGHGGVGLEFRLSRLIAFNVDVLGFIRKRTDDGQAPEFTDPLTGQTTDKSGGGLFRGGLTFWW